MPCECPVPKLNLSCKNCINEETSTPYNNPYKSFDVPMTKSELSEARRIMSLFFDIKERELEESEWEKVS
jgi:hypothetical protein